MARKEKTAVPAAVSKCAAELGRKGARARWAGHVKQPRKPSKKAGQPRKKTRRSERSPSVVQEIKRESGLSTTRPSWERTSAPLPPDALGRSMTIGQVAAAMRRPLQLGPGASTVPNDAKNRAMRAAFEAAYDGPTRTVFVHFLASAPGVSVPESVVQKAQATGGKHVFQLVRGQYIPTHSQLTNGDDELTLTLPIDRRMTPVRIPWSAVVGIVDGNANVTSRDDVGRSKSIAPKGTADSAAHRGPVPDGFVRVMVLPEQTLKSRFSETDTGIVAKFVSPITLFRVIDAPELKLIRASGAITGGKFSVVAERVHGASWGADRDDVIAFGRNWQSSGRLAAGPLYLLTTQGQGRQFYHMDYASRSVGLKEIPRETTPALSSESLRSASGPVPYLMPKATISTGLGASLLVPFADVTVEDLGEGSAAKSKARPPSAPIAPKGAAASAAQKGPEPLRLGEFEESGTRGYVFASSRGIASDIAVNALAFVRAMTSRGQEEGRPLGASAPKGLRLSKSQAEAVRELARFCDDDGSPRSFVYVFRSRLKFVAWASNRHSCAVHAEDTDDDFSGLVTVAILPKAVAAKHREGDVSGFVNGQSGAPTTPLPVWLVIETALNAPAIGNPNLGGASTFLPEGLRSIAVRAVSDALESGFSRVKSRDKFRGVEMRAQEKGGFAGRLVDATLEPRSVATFSVDGAGPPDGFVWGCSVEIASQCVDFVSLPVKGRKQGSGARVMLSGPLDGAIVSSEPRPGRVGRIAMFMPARV